MQSADQGALAATDARLDGKKLNIAIVQARFNASITNVLAQTCQTELRLLGVPEKNITLVQVPGALEIGVALMALAETLKFDALIAIGCVIRGETYHFELVANESAGAVSRVALDYQLPVVNAILTTENLSQAQARQTEKGVDSARVAVEMAHALEAI